jgi:hypothetical protein
MLIFLLGRILPKERPVHVDLPPMERADDAVDAFGAILNAGSTAQITPGEAAALATLVANYARAINVHELETRLDKIERELKAVRELDAWLLGDRRASPPRSPVSR